MDVGMKDSGVEPHHWLQVGVPEGRTRQSLSLGTEAQGELNSIPIRNVNGEAKDARLEGAGTHEYHPVPLCRQAGEVSKVKCQLECGTGLPWRDFAEGMM